MSEKRDLADEVKTLTSELSRINGLVKTLKDNEKTLKDDEQIKDIVKAAVESELKKIADALDAANEVLNASKLFDGGKKKKNRSRSRKRKY